MGNLKNTAACLAIAVAGIQGTAAAQSVYSFGDSLSDNGNVNQISLGLVAGNDYFLGRFSNGYIWVDYLSALSAKAEQETLQGLIGPFFTASDVGYNFAHGGAVSGELGPDVDTSLFGQELGFLSQFGPFRTTAQAEHFRDQDVLFGQRAFIINENDFATISAGGNDYFNGETSVPRVVGNILTAVDAIRQGGIDKMVMLDLPLVGDTPGSILTDNREQLNALSRSHNELLRSEVAAYEAANPDSFIAIVPASRLFEIALLDAEFNNAQLLGFSNVGPAEGTTGSCLGDGLVLDACPSTYLFYDDIHPTARAHQILAEGAVATVRAKLAGDALPLANSRSAKQMSASGNGVIASRLASFRAGYTSSGIITGQTQAFVAGANAVSSNHALTTAGDLNLSSTSGLSVYSFSEGTEIGQLTDLQVSGIRAARAESLTFNEGEFHNSLGVDFLSESNFAFGALVTHAEFNRRQLWATTEDELLSVALYGAWFSGPWSLDGVVRSSRGEQSYQRETGFTAFPILQGRSTTRLVEQRINANYELASRGMLVFSAVGRASMTALRIDDIDETGTMGLFEFGTRFDNEHGEAFYGGLKADLNFQHGRGHLSVESGRVHATNRFIGFSSLLDEDALITDAVDNIGVAQRFGSAAEDGQYAAVGFSLKVTNAVLVTGRAAQVSTPNGHDSVGQMNFAWRF